MASDVRVILIKLADRLHNMRTIAALASTPAKRDRARDTRYLCPDRQPSGRARLGHGTRRPGVRRAPRRYATASSPRPCAAGAPTTKAIVEKVRNAIVRQLKQEALEAEVHGRRKKNVYSIYRKMEAKHLPFEQVHDVYSFRVIVDKRSTTATPRSA